MRWFPVPLGRGLGVLLGVAVTTLAQSQPPAVKAPPAKEAAASSVHKIVIYEGPNRSVHYVATGNLSTGDRLATYELEAAENELTYAQNLQRLKQQYVNSERILEPQRRAVQEQLYGTRISYGSSSGYSGGYGNGGYGNGGYGYGRYGMGGYGYVGGYGYGGGNSPYVFGSNGYSGGLTGFAGSNSYSVVRSLQFGMGDEGRLKDAMVGVIAREATSDYASSTLRGYDAAAGLAANSAVLSRDLSLHKGSAPRTTGEPSFAVGGKVTIWIGKDKYVGTVKSDRPGWVVLQTEKGEVTVRKSEITRSEATEKPTGGPGK